jgi:hypothetical protein
LTIETEHLELIAAAIEDGLNALAAAAGVAG